jgi:hypothetical protein
MMILTDRSTGEVVFEGQRVTRSRRCPICDHDTWCLVDPVRGAAICPRVESARRIGDAGWMHNGDRIPRSTAVERKPELERMVGADAMQERFERQGFERIPMLALSLGLSLRSLRRLHAGWNGSSWTFPMQNHRREIVGFRTRSERGEKFAIRGSRSGLFIPQDVDLSGMAFVVEGPTDVAAMLDMGMNAIGRPSCMGCEEEIARCLMRTQEIVVVADNDEVGLRGAERLVKTIGRDSHVRIILPPMGLKDARQVANHGGVKSDWMELIRDTDERRNTNGRTA